MTTRPVDPKYLRGSLRKKAKIIANGEPMAFDLFRCIVLVDGPCDTQTYDLDQGDVFTAIPNGYEPTGERASVLALYPDRFKPANRADLDRLRLVREVWRYVL